MINFKFKIILKDLDIGKKTELTGMYADVNTMEKLEKMKNDLIAYHKEKINQNLGKYKLIVTAKGVD